MERLDNPTNEELILRARILEQIAAQFFDDWNHIGTLCETTETDFYAAWFVETVESQVRMRLSDVVGQIMRDRDTLSEDLRIAGANAADLETQNDRMRDQLSSQSNQLVTLREEVRQSADREAAMREHRNQVLQNLAALRSLSKGILQTIRDSVKDQQPVSAAVVQIIAEEFRMQRDYDEKEISQALNSGNESVWPLVELTAIQTLFGRYNLKTKATAAKLRDRVVDVLKMVNGNSGGIKAEDLKELRSALVSVTDQLSNMGMGQLYVEGSRRDTMVDIDKKQGQVYEIADIQTLVEAHRLLFRQLIPIMRDGIVAMRRLGMSDDATYTQALNFVEVCDSFANNPMIIVDDATEAKRCTCCGQSLAGHETTSRLNKVGNRRGI